MNPFSDDYKSSSATSTNRLKSYTTRGGDNIEDDVDYYEREIEKYMQESLDSTERSRRHLENSEKIGIQTAQDLLEQREKLEKTERNLDDIHRTTQITQRNLNSLKSVFGGFFRNKFSKKPQDVSKDAEIPQSKSASRLSDTANQLGSLSSGSFSGSPDVHTLSESSRSAIKGTRWEAMDNQIDENLGELVNYMTLFQDNEIQFQMQKILGTNAKTSENSSSMTPRSVLILIVHMKAY
uniref:t-SNARE coiled-coil homology domain-containing protein n=1 Tax=Heterorhabditis bacteriophora TaxID=37862 RepID=A0A1I7XTD8_HETBA